MKIIHTHPAGTGTQEERLRILYAACLGALRQCRSPLPDEPPGTRRGR